MRRNGRCGDTMSQPTLSTPVEDFNYLCRFQIGTRVCCNTQVGLTAVTTACASRAPDRRKPFSEVMLVRISLAEAIREGTHGRSSERLLSPEGARRKTPSQLAAVWKQSLGWSCDCRP